MEKVGKNIRVGRKLVELLDKIIQQEKERGRVITSYKEASGILCKRIENAGGLL